MRLPDKKIIVAVLLLVIIVLFYVIKLTPTVLPSIDTDDWLVYQNKEHGFQILYPPDAKISEPYKILRNNELFSIAWVSPSSVMVSAEPMLPSYSSSDIINIGVYDAEEFFQRSEEEQVDFYQALEKQGFTKKEIVIGGVKVLQFTGKTEVRMYIAERKLIIEAYATSTYDDTVLQRMNTILDSLTFN